MSLEREMFPTDPVTVCVLHRNAEFLGLGQPGAQSRLFLRRVLNKRRRYKGAPDSSLNAAIKATLRLTAINVGTLTNCGRLRLRSADLDATSTVEWCRSTYRYTRQMRAEAARRHQVRARRASPRSRRGTAGHWRLY
jgi:hypothetical protein